MTVKTLAGVLCLLSSLTACNLVSGLPQPAADTSDVSTKKASPTPVRTPKLPERRDAALEAEIAGIAGSIQGKVGVGAVLLETGDAAWLNRNEHFASQSVYKLPIAMAVMKMIDDGRVRIDQDVTITPDDFVRRGFHSPIRNVNPSGTVMPLGEIVRYSISESDGTASDVLLDLAGGPTAVQAYMATFGVTDFIVADSEKAISKDWETQYRNWATPEASVELLRALHDRSSGLSEWTTSFLISTMTFSETGGRRLKRGLPPGATLAHKTGTGGRRTEVPGFRRDANSNTTPSPTATPVRTKKAASANANAANSNVRDPNAPVDPDKVTSATNDIGIITLPDGRHILIAVYIMDSAEDGWTRERTIADIAKAVCDRWYGGGDGEK